MSLYLDPELITDETAAAEGFLSALADRLNAALDLDEDESWVPAEGSPETSIGEAVGIMLATAMAIIAERERADFAAFGDLILRTPRLVAEPASSTARWTFDDDGAFRVPDGSELVIDAPDMTPVAFATVGDADFVATPLLRYVDVPVTAIEPGVIGNELVGPARDWESLPHVASVELLVPSSDGADDETVDAYLERVVRRARRMKLVPIITDDYADTALDHPSVGSAVAVRLLDLTAPTDPPAAPGHVSIFVRGHSGENLDGPTKAEVAALMLGDDRPLAVTAHVGDPTRTDVAIATSIRLATGADEPATTAAVEAAITAAYDDATYGIDENAPGRWRAPRSTAEATINDYDVTALIDDLPGLAKIEDVTINGARFVALAGYAPLPNLTSVTVTVLP